MTTFAGQVGGDSADASSLSGCFACDPDSVRRSRTGSALRRRKPEVVRQRWRRNFHNNVRRLFGLHGLSAEAAKLLGISQSTLVKWGRGIRDPSFATALTIGDFFQVPADRLANAEFSGLLECELADPERYRAVEAKIHRARSELRPVAPANQRRGGVTNADDYEVSYDAQRLGYYRNAFLA